MAAPRDFLRLLILLLALVPSCGVQTPAERLRDRVRSGDSLTYEFEWRRAFDPDVRVRIARYDTSYAALAITYTIPDTLTDPNALLGPVFEVDTTMSQLRRTDWEALEEALDASGFWGMAPHEQDPPGVVIQRTDGADWTLRAHGDSQSHVVVRWSPTNGPDSLFAKAALLMLRLARLTVDPERVY